MHQDVLSEQFCGEGIPQWAVSEDGEKQFFGAFPAPLGKPYVNDSTTGFPTRQVFLLSLLSIPYVFLSPLCVFGGRQRTPRTVPR